MPSLSKRDEEAYAFYVLKCITLGMKPAPLETYLSVTAPINPRPIAWNTAR